MLQTLEDRETQKDEEEEDALHLMPRHVRAEGKGRGDLVYAYNIGADGRSCTARYIII